MWVPLTVRGCIIGGMGLAESRKNHFTAHDADLVLSVANQAAITIINAELYRDTQRKGLSLGIIMLDADNLQAVQRHVGACRGDEILRALGSLLLRQVRGEDIACRYGGDELILILPDASSEVTRERAELICEYAQEFHLQFEGQRLALVTLSLGVAVYPEHSSTSTWILSSVDSALYLAKQQGRGRVVVAE